MILQRCLSSIVEGWLMCAKQSSELKKLTLSDNKRTEVPPFAVLIAM